MPTLRNILTPKGQPRVNVPFTRGGRTYRVTGLAKGGTDKEPIWTYTVEWMECPIKEYPFKEVSEKEFFAGVK
jgi:hypothetical protein